MKKESLTFQVITLEDIENHKTDIEDIEICLLSMYPLVIGSARFYNKEGVLDNQDYDCLVDEEVLNKYMKETVEKMQSLYKERLLKYKERVSK